MGVISSAMKSNQNPIDNKKQKVSNHHFSMESVDRRLRRPTNLGDVQRLHAFLGLDVEIGEKRCLDV